MSVPKSVTRIKTDHVEYISSVDRCQYTIAELSRAALRDVGKFMCYRCNQKAQKIRGMKKSKRVRGRTSTFQYWVRKIEGDCRVGTKHGTWYGEHQELGTSKQPKRNIITSTAKENVAEIIKIESQYLSALENEARALSLINEKEYEGGADD